jgi:hypothetical protein
MPTAAVIICHLQDRAQAAVCSEARYQAADAQSDEVPAGAASGAVAGAENGPHAVLADSNRLPDVFCCRTQLGGLCQVG